MNSKFKRREFLQLAGAGLAASTVTRAQGGDDAAKAVKFGLIGCGGRGRAVASTLVEHAGAQLVALADLFEDKLIAGKEHFDGLLQKKGFAPVSKDRLYRGHQAHRRLLESDVDAVVLAVTPHFYPEIVEAAVAAGKHIYCEKPVATDVAGCLRVLDAAQQVNGRFTFHVGLQIRAVPAMREMVKRIHQGSIGEIVTAQSYFYWGGGNRKRPSGVSHDEARIRTWASDRILSGDIMVEQNVHSLDKLNWVLGSHPVAAVASGGRKARNDFGDVWDHFVAQLHYPNGVTVSFNSTQFLKGWADVCERFFGTKGVSESHYFGGVRIHGENAWDSGVTEVIRDGDITKTREFVSEIASGNYRNEAFQGAESTLTAILVRTAAYEGREMTWDSVISSNQKWDAHIDLSQFS